MRLLKSWVLLCLFAVCFFSSNNFAQTPVAPKDDRWVISKLIGLSPKANSHLIEMVSEVASADAADQAIQLEYELRTSMVDRGPGYLARLLRLYADRGITFEALRAMVSAKFGSKMQISIPVHPKDFDRSGMSAFVDEGNRRLKRLGLDFIEFVAVSSADALRSTEPTPETVAVRDRIQKFRSAFIPTIALATTVAGGYLAAKAGDYHGSAFLFAMVPSTFMGMVYYGTEWQFSKFSALWNRYVWQPLDWRGPLLANAVLPAVFYGMALGAQFLTVYLDSHLGFNTGVTFSSKSGADFLRSWIVQFMLFQGSTGFFQTALGRLTRRGEMSEGSRFIDESGPAIAGNIGRAAGSAAPFFGEAGKRVEPGAEIFSWGLQLGVFFAATVPSWIKLWYGDRHFDEVTASRLKSPDSCRDKVGLLGRLLSPFGQTKFSKH